METQDDISALHSTYTDSGVARVEHNIYTYRINSSGNHLEHFLWLHKRKVNHKAENETRVEESNALGKKICCLVCRYDD